MKIIYLINAMHKSGGVERVIASKVNYWVEQGHEAVIITTDQEDAPYFFEVDPRVRTYDLGLNYHLLNRLPSHQRLWRTYRMQGEHKRRLTEVLMQERADVVVSVWRQEADFLPSISDGSKKVLELHSAKSTPVLMYPEELKLKRLYGRLRVWQMERTAAKYDRLVILAEEERDLWPKGMQVSVIPNPLPFSPTTEPYDASSKVAIAVGRYEYQKNFPDLIRLWVKVHQLCPEWKLQIYGDGPLRSSLQALVQELGLEGVVELPRPTSAIRERYAVSGLYVMTSHFEGLPMVLLEAQAMGLPIVSYACPSGPRDIVTDGADGYLVPLYDQDTFVARLTALMQDDALRQRMSQRAKEASARFAPQRIMQLWQDLFTQIKQGK